MRIAALIAIAALATAPVSAKKSRAPVTDSMKNLGVSAAELRIRVRALARPVLGTVEETADEMIAKAKDPARRRLIVLWKLQATSTLMEAFLRPDPVVALADAWGYSYQVGDFLERDDVAAALGDSLAASRQVQTEIDKQISRVAQGLGPEVHLEELRELIRKWARNHPIEKSLYRRESVDAAIAAEVARTAGGGGALQALGNLDETLADLNFRLDLYSSYLPKQARWHAELLAADLGTGLDPAAALADFTRLTSAFERIATTSEQLPALVQRERAAAFDDLRVERRLILEAVTRERAATLAEAEAIARRLTEESSGALRTAVTEERKQALQEVEAMRYRLLDEVAAPLDAVVDHAFKRAVQLLLMAFAFLAIGGFLGLRYALGRRSAI